MNLTRIGPIELTSFFQGSLGQDGQQHKIKISTCIQTQNRRSDNKKNIPSVHTPYIQNNQFKHWHQWFCLQIYAVIRGESLLCGYQLPKHRWFICSCWSYLSPPLYTHRPLCAPRPQTLKLTDTNEHKHSRTANPLVHIRYAIFSSCFSSAFPNGWLNQLCGAWFKSSGMLGYCQRLVGQQGGNKVTGGEQLTSSSTFIKACLYHLRSREQMGFKNIWVWSKNSQHIHSGKDTPSLRTYTL